MQSRVDIVGHSIDLFRRIRNLVHEHGIPDGASVHLFLFVLSRMMAEQEAEGTTEGEHIISAHALDPSFLDVYRSFEPDTLESLTTQFRSPVGTVRELQVIPELLVRHASGTIFQEAHYEFLRGAPTDLFGLPGPATVKIDSRGGTHFTPPGLARSIAEQSLGEIEADNLTVLDPSCGAGAFLHETLRILQRREYQGEVSFLGYDISPNAIAMARFTLAQARRDWPEGRIKEIRLEARDSLSDDCMWPQADVILMNPPFISWGGLTPAQREQTKSMLGKGYAGRPDYSMAFIEKALNSIKYGGVVGTLMPSSILSLNASLVWRDSLLDRATPKYLAVLGDHALFRNAMVEAAYAVFVKRDEEPDDRVIELWTSEKRGTAGEALRNLRKFDARELRHTGTASPALQSDEDWRISVTNTAHLAATPDWRPRPNRLENVLNEIRDTTQTQVRDLFHVREGVRTGLRRAFIVPQEEYQQLPKRERPYLRQVAENRNIRDGRILPQDYIFYPFAAGLEQIRDETELRTLLPNYYKRFLEPNRNELMERAGLLGRNWWVLHRHRSWLEQPKPKLVSTFFGDAGSFAFDDDGEYVVVQGFGWLVREPLEQEFDSVSQEAQEEYQSTVTNAYLALLNSSFFSSLLAEFCPHVAGGQYNLSKRFVDQIPIPNLGAIGQESPTLGATVTALGEEGKKIHLGGLDSVYAPHVDRLVADTYRIPLELWLETDR